MSPSVHFALYSDKTKRRCEANFCDGEEGVVMQNAYLWQSVIIKQIYYMKKQLLALAAMAMFCFSSSAQDATESNRLAGTIWARETVEQYNGTFKQDIFYVKCFNHTSSSLVVAAPGNASLRKYYLKGDTAIVEDHVVSPIKFLPDGKMELTWVANNGQKVKELWKQITIKEFESMIVELYSNKIVKPLMEGELEVKHKE